MPEVALKLMPGVNVERTYALNEAGISACQLIRFKAGLPQKLGGWTRFYPFSIQGITRCLHAWGDLNGIERLAVGSTEVLGVITAGTFQDITPQTIISDFAPNFTTTMGDATIAIVDPNISNVTTFDAVFFNTPVSIGGLILQGAYQIASVLGTHSYSIIAATNAPNTELNAGTVPTFDSTLGSSIVTVTLADHGLSDGDLFTFPIPTTVGGVTILGTYPVSNTAPTTFDISASALASSTATVDMNGGEAELLYYIALGPSAAGVGFGVGPFGAGGFGSGVVPPEQIGDPITTTDWTLDNWGQILIACPRNGGIYQWTPGTGFQNAQLVSTAPIFNGGIFVAMPEQILVAWGSTTFPPEQQDPLIVRWSDSLDYTNWVVSSLTQAGSFRVPEGSKIMGGLQGPQQALIWTDLAVWSMAYQGLPYVFGFNKISEGCGLIGPHAACIMRGVVYWMGVGNFFALGGGAATPVPCSIWDFVFQNLDTANQTKCVAAPNSTFDEVTFYFPSASGGSGEIDSYVKMNIDEGSWDYGTLSRTAWIDQSVLGQPIGVSSNGLIFQHETSNDADGGPINSFFESGYFVVAEGQSFSFVDWIFPDMKWGEFGGSQNASVQVTIYAATYPNSTPKAFGPFNMTSAKTFINCRLRNRLIRIRIESNDVGSFWRLGKLMIRMAPDGRR